jgi:hypothetical protein
MAPKKIGQSSIIGEKGIAVIRRIVLEMGFMFYETGSVEAGIDGFIELRDDRSGKVGNLILQVQGKATERRFTGEDENSFEWPCNEDDVAYWLYGTAPVLLIVVRTTDNVAYWKSIKDYFHDARRLQDRRVVFDKLKDSFTPAAKHALIELAASTRPGVVSPPARMAERLVLNLLPVERLGPRLYLAETEHQDNKSFGEALRALTRDAPGEWVVKGSRVLSFHNLEDFPWNKLCDSGTVEDFPTDEWALTDDAERLRDFVQLLNRALQQFTRSDLFLSKIHNCFYFRRAGHRWTRAYSYRSFERETARNVVKAYTKKRNPNEHAYFRHSAFQGQFLRFDKRWLLEITPTYYFTSDGFRESAFFEERLKKIKELENNGAVVGQFQMWRHYLTNSSHADLFKDGYPFLAFGSLEDFDLDRGVPDELWRAREDRDRAPLFEEDNSEP